MIHKTAEINLTARIGNKTMIWNNSQVRENVIIGEECVLGKNVYVDVGVKIGNKVKIQNNVSIYEGITIEDEVFIGPHVVFANDKYPRATTCDGLLKKRDNWKVEKTLLKKGASIGANATILPGIIIGSFAMIGSGAVVTKDVPPYALVLGNPSRIGGYVCKCGKPFKTDNQCKICGTNILDIKK